MAEETNTGRHKEILTAAERVFEASGYAQTTMDMVAAEAGISKGSIYNYFSSKQDLFRQIFAEAMAASEQKSLVILGQPISASAKIHRLLDHWFSSLGYHKRIGRLVLEFWASAARQQQGEMGKAFAATYALWRRRLADMIGEGVRAGEFRQDVNTTMAASLLMGVLDGIEVQSMLDLGLNVDGEFLAALKRAILIALTSGNDAVRAE